jgi:superfamily II DNA/RNA helicase
LHGGRTQAERTRALNRFKDGDVTALVATDVAARGIHVDDVSLVLHVDPPAEAKDYLHRSGRTARAGSSGVVVTIVTPPEERNVRAMLSAAGVDPKQRDARPGSGEVRAVTGAKQPSGVPVVRAPKQHRPPSSPRPDSARRDSFSDRRPSRSGNRSAPARGAARRRPA